MWKLKQDINNQNTYSLLKSKNVLIAYIYVIY